MRSQVRALSPRPGIIFGDANRLTLTPLDTHDVRLRQACAQLTRPQLRQRAQQLEIDALLDYVYGVNRKDLSDFSRHDQKPKTVGLSAPQVGIMKQITIVDLSIGRRGYHDIHVLLNPRLTWSSQTVVGRIEGCVNFETVWGETRRSRSIRIAALDRSGNEIEMKLSGWPATLMQHEIDHLHGHLFIDRLIDPRRAHLVTDSDFGDYRKAKSNEWEKVIDVSDQVVATKVPAP